MCRTTGKTDEPDWGSCSQDSGSGQMVTVYIIDTANINHYMPLVKVAAMLLSNGHCSVAIVIVIALGQVGGV